MVFSTYILSVSVLTHNQLLQVAPLYQVRLWLIICGQTRGSDYQLFVCTAALCIVYHVMDESRLLEPLALSHGSFRSLH